jgi:hypothetical protein
VNAHFHKYSVSLEDYETTRIGDYLEITSYQIDDNGLKFVDSFQGKNGLNINGVQFHPDKLVDPTYYKDLYGDELWALAQPVSQTIADFALEQAKESSYCRDNDSNPLIDFKSGKYPLSGVCRETISYYINDKGFEDQEYICAIEEES